MGYILNSEKIVIQGKEGREQRNRKELPNRAFP
jgi:hypothetical protein